MLIDFNDSRDYQKSLFHSLLLSGFFTLIIFFLSYLMTSNHLPFVKIGKYLDIPLGILSFLCTFALLTISKDIEEDYIRGLTLIIHIIALIYYNMFIFRKLLLGIGSQILCVLYYIEYYPHKDRKLLIGSTVRILIAISLTLFFTCAYLKEIKTNFRLRQSLIKKESLYRQFMNSMKDAVIILSLQKGIIFQNQESRDRYHVSNENWVNLCSSITLSSQSDSTLVDIIWKMIAGKGPNELNIIEEEFIYHENNSLSTGTKILNVTLLGSQLFEEEKTMAIVIKDITKRRKYDEERIGNKSKTKIFNSLSHEIRTPLNAIVGMIQIIKEKVTDKELLQHLNIAESNSYFLQNQLSDILDFGQILNSKFRAHIDKFSVHNLFDQLIKLTSPLMHKTHLYLRADIDQDVPEVISSDIGRISQILSNFLMNSIKFTERGHIALLSKYRHPNIIFGVSDTGKGIEEEKCKNLFKMNSNEDIDIDIGSLPKKYSISGMGLTISQVIAQALGSKIKVRTALGKGSFFYFKINIQSIPEDQLPSTELNNEIIDETCQNIGTDPKTFRVVTNSSYVMHPEEKNYSHKVIIIVDDNNTNRFVIRGMMKDFCSFLTIEEANNGFQALNSVSRLLRKGAEILVFMDLDMPVMDGITAIQNIRALPGGNSVSILVVTAFTSEEQRVECEKAGIQDFFYKPVRRDSIKKAVYTYLL